MMSHQGFDHGGMVESDCEQFEIIPTDFLAEKGAAWGAQFQFFQTCLDSRLPTAGDTYKLPIFRIFDRGFGSGGKERIVPKEPQHCLGCRGADRSFHVIPEILKRSVEIWSHPVRVSLALPALHGHCFKEARVSVATGSPSFVMVNGSPGFKPAMICCKCACASSMFTLDMSIDPLFPILPPAARIDESRLYLGNLASDCKEYDEALRQYNEAVASRTNFAEAEFGIGWVYRQQGRIEDALAQFDKVIRIQPAHAGAYVALAVIRAEQMNWTAAISDYDKAIGSYEMQIQRLASSINALDKRAASRAVAAEKKRREREKATLESALENIRTSKSSLQQILQTH